MSNGSLPLVFYIGKFASTYATDLPNHADGTSNIDGTTKTGRRTHGRENDSDHNHVSAH